MLLVCGAWPLVRPFSSEKSTVNASVMVEMVVVPTPTCVATKRNAKLRYRTFLPPVDTSFDKKLWLIVVMQKNVRSIEKTFVQKHCKKPQAADLVRRVQSLRPRTTQSLIVKHYPLSKQLLRMVFHLWLGINFETVGSKFFISRAIEPQFTGLHRRAHRKKLLGEKSEDRRM